MKPYKRYIWTYEVKTRKLYRIAGVFVGVLTALQPLLVVMNVSAVSDDSIALSPVTNQVEQGSLKSWKVLFGKNVTPKDSSTEVTLTTTSPTGMISPSASGGAPWSAGSVTIAFVAGQKSKTFSYYDTTPGDWTITATATGGGMPSGGLQAVGTAKVGTAVAPTVTANGNLVSWSNPPHATGAKVEIIDSTNVLHTETTTDTSLTPTVPNGAYTARVTPLFASYYGAGDTTRVGTTYGEVELTVYNAPQASVTDIIASAGYGGKIGGIQTFTATTSGDATSVQLKSVSGCGESATGSGKVSIDTSSVTNGTCTISATATDSNGNASEIFTKNFSIDNTKPKLTLTQPKGALIDNDTITGMATSSNGLKSLTYAIDGRSSQSTVVGDTGRFNIAIVGLKNGEHTLTVQVVNQFGGMTTAEQKFTVKNSITIAFATAPERWEYNSVVSGTIATTAKYDRSQLKVFTDAGVVVGEQALAVKDGKFVYNLADLALPNGGYTVRVSAWDAVNESPKEANQSIAMRTIVPVTTVGLTSSSISATHNATLTLAGSVSNPSRVATVRVLLSDGSELSSVHPLLDGSWSLTIPVTAAGTYSYAVQVVDILGNFGAPTAMHSITIAPYKPPSSELNVSLGNNLDGRRTFAEITEVPTVGIALNTTTSSGAETDADSENDAPKSFDAPLSSPAQVDAPLAPSSQGWELYGVAWYWWGLLAVGIIIVAWWNIASYRHRNV